MTLKKLLIIAVFLVGSVVLSGQGQGLDPADILKPLKDSWPTYNGDYSGKRYSPLNQINQTTVKNLTLAWFVQRLTSGAGARRERRRRRHRRFPAGRRRHQGHGADGRRHALPVDARQRLGDRRARRPRAVALLLEDARRHAHRQSRPRHVAQLPVHGDAGRLSGVARREDGQGALAQDDRGSGAAVFLDARARSSSAITCSSAPATTSTARASCSRSIPKPAKLQWKLYTVPMNPGDPGLDTWAEPRRGAARRRAALAARRLRSRHASLHLRHRQSDAGLHRGPRATATTSTRRR